MDFNWKWLSIFVAQIGVGLVLLFLGEPEVKDMAMLLLGGAFGQGVTGSMKVRYV